MAKSAPLTKIGRICSKCGCDKPFSNFYTNGKKVDGSPKYASWCSSCIKTKMASYHKRTWGREKLQYTAFKRTRDYRNYLSYLLSKARRRGECTINLNYLCSIWEKQQGMCAITGWQMTMRLADGVVSTNASIDRINSSIGYKEGNIQLVCRCANVAKHDLTMEDFIMLCRAVIERETNG